jgi:hypothetical protein
VRARTRVVRADDMEALRLPLVGAVMGPEGPITWLPTLNRGREGLQRQGLMRVVTDTPVTTRAVAKATRESGRRALRALASPPSRHASPYRGVVHARCDGRRGARWPRRSRLSRTSVEPTSGGAVGTALAPDLCAIGSSRDVRSLLRQAACRRAITQPELAGTDFTLPMLLGASISMRVSSATPGYLNPGTPKGLARITADGGIACTQETQIRLPRRRRCSSAERWGFEGGFPRVTRGPPPENQIAGSANPSAKVECIRQPLRAKPRSCGCSAIAPWRV